MDILTLFTALGCGLNAGIFYAFTSFVMRALGNLPPAEGAAAMQRINIDVITPSFMIVFMGTAALSLGLIVGSAIGWDTASIWRVSGAVCYLLGTFGVTMLFNVPLNNRLAGAETDDDGAADVWRRYLRVWTRWNTVRTFAALVGCACLFMAG